MDAREERQLVKFVKFMTFLLIVLIIVEMVRCSRTHAAAIPTTIEQSRYFDRIKIKSSGFKCYTRYTAITRKSSLQYKLQKEYAYTGDYGIRMVNGRFCIAVGTGVTKRMGQYVDVYLENGTMIPCIVADQKADQHTKADRITTAHNGCVCEFYLDTVLPEIKYCGDVSKACTEWESPVCEFRVYTENVFD